MHRKGKLFLLHMWHPSCYSCHKPGDKSWITKGTNCDYGKRNISMFLCNTDIQERCENKLEDQLLLTLPADWSSTAHSISHPAEVTTCSASPWQVSNCKRGASFNLPSTNRKIVLWAYSLKIVLWAYSLLSEFQMVYDLKIIGR